MSNLDEMSNLDIEILILKNLFKNIWDSVTQNKLIDIQFKFTDPYDKTQKAVIDDWTLVHGAIGTVCGALIGADKTNVLQLLFELLEVLASQRLPDETLSRLHEPAANKLVDVIVTAGGAYAGEYLIKRSKDATLVNLLFKKVEGK